MKEILIITSSTEFFIKTAGTFSPEEAEKRKKEGGKREREREKDGKIERARGGNVLKELRRFLSTLACLGGALDYCLESFIISSGNFIKADNKFSRNT